MEGIRLANLSIELKLIENEKTRVDLTDEKKFYANGYALILRAEDWARKQSLI